MAETVQIEEGELAVKLTSDISGGLGSHKAGTVLRRLSVSAFKTLTGGGLGEQIKSSTTAKTADASTPPKGSKATS